MSKMSIVIKESLVCFYEWGKGMDSIGMGRETDILTMKLVEEMFIAGERERRKERASEWNDSWTDREDG
jgi:hypothetical protein